MPAAPADAVPRRWRWAVLAVAGVAVGLGLSYGVCTQDDAFISFRYALNLVDGHGLVYNPGERVEGFTNLLWTVLLALPLSVGIDPVAASTALGLGALALAVVLTGGLSAAVRTSAPGLAALAGAVMLAMDPQAALEAVEGLETALHMAIVAATALVLVRELRPAQVAGASDLPWHAHLGSGALLGVLCVSRPEAPILALGLHLGLLWVPPCGEGQRRAVLLRAVVAAVPVVLVLAALTGFRLVYYGELLPNTFYAKTGGQAVERGLGYVWGHIVDHPVLWGIFAFGLARLRRRPVGMALAGAAVLHLLYVVWVGGDFKPTGRFIMPVMPLMVAVGVGGVLAPSPGLGTGSLRARVLAVLSLVLVVRGVQVDQVCREWAAVRHANLESRRTLGLFLQANLPPGTWMAIHSAGAVPFYAGLPTIDMWGLTDHHIARAPIVGMGTGMAGHERSDPEYVFSRNPALYLPEDRMFVLSPFQLEVEPGFPDDFLDNYQSLSIPIEGRVLNCWVRKGFLRELQQ